MFQASREESRNVGAGIVADNGGRAANSSYMNSWLLDREMSWRRNTDNESTASVGRGRHESLGPTNVNQSGGVSTCRFFDVWSVLIPQGLKSPRAKQLCR
jgi:hypothetical protein